LLVSFSRAALRSKFPLLYRYIFAEIVSPFFLTLFVFTGILFLARVLKLVDLVVNRSIPFFDIVLLFSYIVPAFLEVAIPMSVLIAVLSAFGRLSVDSELVVIRAAGISLQQLTIPVLVFATLAFLASLSLSFWVRPWANLKLGEGLFEIAKVKASAGLTEGTFSSFGTLTMYAEKVDDQTGTLTNVIIADNKGEEKGRVFFAQRGIIVSDPKERTIVLQLFDGSLSEGAAPDLSYTEFEINSILLPQSELIEGGSRESKKSNEQVIGTLLSSIDAIKSQPRPLPKEIREHLASSQVELQRRLVIPFATFVVAIVGMALGIQPSRGARSWGTSANFTLGISVVIIYYLLLAVTSAIGSNGRVHPALVMWIPNVVFAALGVYLLQQVGSERWSAVSQRLGDLIAYLNYKLKLRTEEAR
jgi:lipopolysaccharide export system permease protein